MDGKAWLNGQGYRAIDEKAFARMAEHIEQRPQMKGLLLIGDPGTGKTMFCQLVVGKLNVVPCRQIVAAAEDENTSRRGVLRDLRDVANIALDDLGQEPKLYGAEFMNDVIDELYSRGFGRVYITSNLWPQDLRKRYGDRTISRILGMTSVVYIKASDQRVAEAVEVKP